MSLAALAHGLDAHHAVTGVRLFTDTLPINRLPEARPTGARIVFAFRKKKLVISQQAQAYIPTPL